MPYLIDWRTPIRLYALENNYSKDEKGVGLKKDKAMDKLVQLENKGELEKWATEQLAKK